jgi:hypothetical protein
MWRESIQSGMTQVGIALRDPEEFAIHVNADDVRTAWSVWLALLLTAIAGTTTYGMTMGLLGGGRDVLVKGVICTLAAGLAWGIPLPALYILNSLSGSKLSAGSTLLAALVTTSWGGLAMIASIPINWFFTVAIPHPGFVLLVNLTVFAGVGVAMMDVFHRAMRKLEPARPGGATWWLLLVGAIGAELFYSFGLFTFTSLKGA